MRHQLAANNRDNELLTYLSNYIYFHGYSPSIAEIATRFTISESAVGKRLARLQAFGWITRQPRKVRAITINKVVAA